MYYGDKLEVSNSTPSVAGTVTEFGLELIMLWHIVFCENCDQVKYPKAQNAGECPRCKKKTLREILIDDNLDDKPVKIGG